MLTLRAVGGYVDVERSVGTMVIRNDLLITRKPAPESKRTLLERGQKGEIHPSVLQILEKARSTEETCAVHAGIC
jgi:hypothetical protein